MVHSCDTCLSITYEVVECTYWCILHYQSTEECSPTLSTGKSRMCRQLKCRYTKTYSLGNSQQEAEPCAQSEISDIIWIIETWWEKAHGWMSMMYGYKIFRKEKNGRRGVGVVLYVKGSQCM